MKRENPKANRARVDRNSDNGRAVLLSGAWLLACGLGMFFLLSYAYEPGEQGEPPQRWPDRAELARSTARLLVFIHPHCPCSKATISELARLMAQCNGGITAKVIFFEPLRQSDSGTRTAAPDSSGLFETAKAIPGVTACWDKDGSYTRIFGARTSGHTLLYSADGQLLFSGGITLARGHEGDNPGSSAVTAFCRIENDTPASPTRGLKRVQRCSMPVFGCPLSEGAEPL